MLVSVIVFLTGLIYFVICLRAIRGVAKVSQYYVWNSNCVSTFHFHPTSHLFSFSSMISRAFAFLLSACWQLVRHFSSASSHSTHTSSDHACWHCASSSTCSSSPTRWVSGSVVRIWVDLLLNWHQRKRKLAENESEIFSSTLRKVENKNDYLCQPHTKIHFEYQISFLHNTHISVMIVNMSFVCEKLSEFGVASHASSFHLLQAKRQTE